MSVLLEDSEVLSIKSRNKQKTLANLICYKLHVVLICFFFFQCGFEGWTFFLMFSFTFLFKLAVYVLYLFLCSDIPLYSHIHSLFISF